MATTNESKLNHSLKMSRKVLLNTKVKNQHEHNKLGFTLKQMLKDQEKQEIKCSRDISSTREQYRRMRASTEAYREHSFERYDPFLKKRNVVRDITNIPGYTYIRSWRRKEASEDRNRQQVQRNQGLLVTWKSFTEKDATSQGTETKSKWAIAKGAIQVKTPEKKTQENTTTEQAFETFLRNATGHSVSAPVRRIRRREKTFSYSRDRTIFPGACKSSYESRKFMEQEVTNIMFSLSPEGQRKAKIDKLKAEAQLPDFFKRSRTLSAILRNYKEYKKETVPEQPTIFLTT